MSCGIILWLQGECTGPEDLRAGTDVPTAHSGQTGKSTVVQMGGSSIVRRSRNLRLQTINPVLIALLLAWSAEGAHASPSPSPSGSQDGESSVSPYLILGAMAAGFAATYALLLSGNDRSYSRIAPASAGASVGVPPQQPGAPGGSEGTGGAETPGGNGTPEDSPTAGSEGPGTSAPTTQPARTSEAPEPGTLLLLGAGAAAIFAARSRRSRR